MVDGSTILTAALVEPGNSDPTSPRTTARADGDSWRLDGTKAAGTRRATGQRHRRLRAGRRRPGLFVVDTDDDGVDVTPVPHHQR